jgi:hypothetical protein
MSVQNTPVRDVADLRRALDAQDLKRGMRLQVRSGNATRHVFVQSDAVS